MKCQVRNRLGLRPGDRVEFVIDESGDVRLHAGGIDVADLRGLLRRRGGQRVSLEEMERAIRRGASRR